MASRKQETGYRGLFDEAQALDEADREVLTDSVRELANVVTPEQFEEFEDNLKREGRQSGTADKPPFSVCRDSKYGRGAIDDVAPRRQTVGELCESGWSIIEAHNDAHEPVARILTKIFEVYTLETKRLYDHGSLENDVSTRELLAAQFGDRWVALECCLRSIERSAGIFFNTRQYFGGDVEFTTVPEILALCLVNRPTLENVEFRNEYRENVIQTTMPRSQRAVVDKICGWLCEKTAETPEKYAYNTGVVFAAALESEFRPPMESAALVADYLRRLRENEAVVPYLPSVAFTVSVSGYPALASRS